MTEATTTERAQALQAAFAQFNATSRHLETAWASLEARVAELTRQRDQAEQAQLQELQVREQLAERLQALLEALPGAAVMLDKQGRIRECNAGARDLLGEPLHEQRWRDVAARALRAESDIDGTPRLADGRRLNVSRRAMSDGASVLLLTDDSADHARRSGVQRQRHLSDMEQMNARLAHQLRTPLAAALLYLSRLADGTLDADTSARIAGKALDRLRDLQQLIDSTLALARGDSGTEQTIAVSTLLDEVRQLADSRIAADRQMRFDCPRGMLNIRGQRQLLCSALLNLIENALAFGDCVQITARHDDHRVSLRVHDNGAGIAAADATRIFEPFYTTRADGTGLGLSMARSVAEAHAGSLTLEPTSSGTCFVLSLPRAESGTWLNSGPLLSASAGGAA